MTKKERVFKILVCACCIWCVAFSVVFPKAASEAAFGALALCAKRVVPSLFLFIVASKIFLSCGGASLVSAVTGGGLEKILNISKSGSAAVFLGLICGYPTGAVVIAQAFARSEMDKREAQSLLPFVTAASPAFLIGTVGSALFGSAVYGAVLFAAQILSSFILLFATRKKRLGCNFSQETEKEREPLLPLLAKAVKEGGISLIYVCSFITFFCVFSQTFLHFIPGAKSVNALVNGFFEISGGFALLASLECSLFEKYFLGGAMLGFAGISVFMQSASFVCECGISMKKYAVGKAVQSILCGAISCILGILAESGAENIAFSLFGTKAPKLLMGAEFALISALVLAVILAFAAVCVKILRFFSKK